MKLGPEEIAAMKAAIAEAEAPDPMEKLASSIKYLCEETDSLKEELRLARDETAALKSLVMDQLIGGLVEAYTKKVEDDEFAEFKSKHGARLDPFLDKWKEAFPEDGDLHGRMFRHLRSMKGDEGYTEESGAAELEKLIGEIKERLGIEDAPAVVEIKGSVEEEPEADAMKAWNEIEAMKRRENAREKRKGA